MSGGSARSRDRNRSNRRPIRTGSTAVMPRQKHTAELAAEPRPWHRMFAAPAELDDLVHRQEVAAVVELLDQRQLGVELRATSAGTSPP
jgi:hypothetical protein